MPTRDSAPVDDGLPAAPKVSAEKLIDVDEAKEAAKARPATFSDLRAKRRRKDTVRIPTTDEDGQPVELLVKIQAIGGVDYDELQAKHKPTREQKEDGAIYNHTTFIPALIAACTTEPRLDYSQAQELYNSEEWAGGEISSWFIACQRVNNVGIEVPFSATG